MADTVLCMDGEKINKLIYSFPCLGNELFHTAYAYCGKSISFKCSTTFALVFGEEIPCLPYGEAGTVHFADGKVHSICAQKTIDEVFEHVAYDK